MSSWFDHAALKRAAAGGPYKPHEISNLTPADLAKYFVERDGQYTVIPSVRSAIHTRTVNLLNDRFERDLDLIVCRNVMIYFESDVKSDLIRRFQDSLRPNGVLFIGATEALIGQDLQGFDRLGGNFYRRQAATALRAA